MGYARAPDGVAALTDARCCPPATRSKSPASATGDGAAVACARHACSRAGAIGVVACSALDLPAAPAIIRLPRRPPRRAVPSGSARIRAAGRSTPRSSPRSLRLVAGLPLARDQLIEHLHRLQDALGHLPVAHLTALAELLRLAPVEVYEVASFYHHFDVVREGEPAPAALTIRVCTSLSCALAGGADLAAQAASALGPGVRVAGASCLGRCDTAPAALCGARAIGHATVEAIERAAADRRLRRGRAEVDGYDAYRAAGGYALYAECRRGDARRRRHHRHARRCAAARARRRRISDRPQMATPCAASPDPATSPSTSTKASRARSRTGTAWKPTRTASSKAR